MDMKQIVLLLVLIIAFMFIYIMRVSHQCPAQPFATQQERS